MVTLYYLKPIGMHSHTGDGVYYKNEKTEHTVAGSNLYQTLRSFGKESTYLRLQRDLPSRMLTYFDKDNVVNYKIKKGLVKIMP